MTPPPSVWTMLKKTALFLHGGFPKLLIRWQQYCGRGGAVRRTVSIGFDVFHFKLNLKHFLQTFPPIDLLRKKTLPKAQRTQGLSFFTKVTASMMILQFLISTLARFQFQNLDQTSPFHSNKTPSSKYWRRKTSESQQPNLSFRIAHLSLPWSNGWVALSFLVCLFVCSSVRPAMVTPNQISTFFNIQA